MKTKHQTCAFPRECGACQGWGTVVGPNGKGIKPCPNGCKK
ncbi:hypothetical protein [Streptomyces xiamenensis]